ncbi:MAG: hypothetical protein JWN78_543 [Bacteroidota bacterium]|nr:hypothetical protein [Bacteroidota bacterium]
MVDTQDLKSCGHRGCAGSSPAPGTLFFLIYTQVISKLNLLSFIIFAIHLLLLLIEHMKKLLFISLAIVAFTISGCKKISKTDRKSGCMYCTVHISSHKGCPAQTITYQQLYDASPVKSKVDLCKFYDSLRARPVDQCGNHFSADDITIDCPK